jgi:hypothetical protein
MYNNRLLKVVAVVVMLMAVAASGVAAASAPTAPERNVASSHCQAILRQELGTVMPSGWSGYLESDCSLTGERSAGLATLDNPNHQWIGPETVSAALGQQSNSVTYGSSEWAAALGGSAAQGQQSYSLPTTGGSGKLDNQLAPLDWYFAHDHAILDGDNNVVSSGENLVNNRLARLDELARIKDDVFPVDSRATQMARLDELARIKDDVFPGDARAARLARLDELARIKDDVFPVDSRATQTVSAALGQQSYSVTYGSSEWAAALGGSAPLGQQPSSIPTMGGSGDLTSGAAIWRDEGARSIPTTGGLGDSTSATDGVLDPTRGY